MYAYEKKYNLIYHMSMTSIALKEGLRKEFLKNGYDITIDNFAVLSRLWQQDNLTQQQLCELTCKNKSNLTRILDTMEKKGMIQRKLNLTDRRSFSIALTDYSHSLKNYIPEIAEEYGNKIFDKLSERDIENLESIFSKLNNVLEENK